MTILLIMFLFTHWEKEPGIRVQNGGSPYVISLSDTAFRLYFSGMGTPSGIQSAISYDGLNFVQESGVRITPGDSMEDIVADPTVVQLSNGYRMYYKGATGPGGPGQARHRIFSAFSQDGLDWTREGLRYQNLGYPDYGWTSVPDAIKLRDGRTRIYYTSATGGIRSIISYNGLDFTAEDGVRLAAVDPNVIYLSDSTYRMFFATQVGQSQHIGYTNSQDGLNFTIIDTIISPGGPNDSLSCIDPSAIILSDGRTRVYYGGMNRNQMAILSAISPMGEISETADRKFFSGIKISPNPAKAVFSINSSLLPNSIVKIFNSMGNLIKEYEPTNNEILISVLENGIFFVVLEVNQIKITKKVIITK